VNLLLDTHTFLWHANGDPQISSTATALLIDPTNHLFLSMASMWEMAIKSGLRKLILSGPFGTFMTRAITGYGLTVLPITQTIALATNNSHFLTRTTAILLTA
jgi:PIN domain nuclease of toxin-antitoxin system